MGTYYKYVNHTRREYVDLSDLRGGGDKMNAVLWCGAVLGYLLMPGNGELQYDRPDCYQGRWHSSDVGGPMAYQKPLPATASPQVVNVEADYEDWWMDIEPKHHVGGSSVVVPYTNITAGVLTEMREYDFDYFDRVAETGQRNCPEYHSSGDGFEQCVLPRGHTGKHAYGDWVPLHGDELKQYRRKVK